MIKSKKHIVFCTTSYFEYDRRVQRIITVLTKNGYSIAWFSRRYNNKSQDLPEIFHQKISTYFKSGVFFYLEINIKFFLKLLLSNADAICSIDNDTILACYYAAKFKRKRLIFDAHEIFHEVPELIDKPLKKWVWKNISKRYYPKIKSKYTVNESLKSVFKDEFNTEFKVIRNVPELQKSETNRLSNLPNLANKTIVYLGVLNEGRGIELAIKALLELKDYSLKLIGDGDLAPVFKNLVKQLNLESRVTFLGYLDPSDIYKALATSSVGINMLLFESLNYKLSLANKFFDYVHASLPSVNMNYPEYKKINDEYEVCELVDNYTVEDLTAGIKKLESESRYEEIQSNCHSAKQVFNWQKESQYLLEIYDNI